VPFRQTIDLRGASSTASAFEEMVVPNEIHGFLRHDSWLRVDTATADFFARKLGAPRIEAVKLRSATHAEMNLASVAGSTGVQVSATSCCQWHISQEGFHW
jgi:hypothetical protein